MAARDNAERFHAETPEQWRAWLEANHERDEGVWLVFWRRVTGRPAMTYDEAITEAVAFGWVDSSSAAIDEERSMLWFVKRRPSSAWSGTNKARVARLEREGRLAPAGRRMVDTARANGMWTVLDGPEALEVPPELASAFDANTGAREAWQTWTPGARKAALTKIALAKRADTRLRHVATIVNELLLDSHPDATRSE